MGVKEEDVSRNYVKVDLMLTTSFHCNSITSLVKCTAKNNFKTLVSTDRELKTNDE